jgi:hypothetical protein
VEAGGVEPPSKTVAFLITTSVSSVLNLDAALCRGRLSGSSSSIALARYAPNRDYTADPDFIRPGNPPTGSWGADLVVANLRVRRRRRSCYSQLLFLLVFYVANENPRLAIENQTGPVEPVRPHIFFSMTPEGRGTFTACKRPRGHFFPRALTSSFASTEVKEGCLAKVLSKPDAAA